MANNSDEQAAEQHYLFCGNQDCQKNGQFYCNDCHQPMCEQCKDDHRESYNTKEHDIVLYRQRKHQLPVEKCKLHPTRNVDIFCKECKTPLCLKCFIMKGHKGHDIDDLEDIYAEKYALWQSEFSKIQKYFLPTSEGLKKEIENDVTEIENIMESIRTSIKAEAESMKNLLYDVISEKIEHTYLMEKFLLQMLKSQEKNYEDYIQYLWKSSALFEEYLSIKNQKLLSSELLTVQSIPETSKLVPPVFTAGQFNKDNVAKLLGGVNFPNTEPQKRKIQPLEVVLMKQNITKSSDFKQTLSLSPSLTMIKEYNLPDVSRACHVSVDKSSRLWVNDFGKLVQTDLQGNLLQKIQTNGTDEGYHTVTQDGDQIYTDRDKKIIFKITPDTKIKEFILTGDWKPLSIHSSWINGNILVGMYKDREAKISRYSKTGTEIPNIKMDNQGQELYDYPHYITENINGDICTSDHNKHAVVVVNKSGQHRFSYKGQGSWFRPYGICTDVLGHILVCDRVSDTVHLLDQDGGFLTVILSEQQGIRSPRGVCVDDENNLYVGQYFRSTVKVYKYLQ